MPQRPTHRHPARIGFDCTATNDLGRRVINPLALTRKASLIKTRQARTARPLHRMALECELRYRPNRRRYIIGDSRRVCGLPSCPGILTGAGGRGPAQKLETGWLLAQVLRSQPESVCQLVR